ncbi:Uncharacterized protein QTN25_002665 [Entamoeba marina]
MQDHSPQETQETVSSESHNQPSDNNNRLTTLQQRKKRIARNSEDRLGLITGKVKEIKEKNDNDDEVDVEKQPQPQNNDTEVRKSAPNPYQTKFKNISIGLFILFIGSIIGHFSGYSILSSEFIEGFISCFIGMLSLIIYIISKLMNLLPNTIPKELFSTKTN